MTTALIILPLAAALVVWLLPLPGRVSGVIALLAALAEVAPGSRARQLRF